MRSIVFDLDGTLADTSGDLVAAANYCFRDMGAGDQLTVADAGTALRGGRAMLLLGLERMGRPADEALVARYYQVLLDAYEAEIDTHSVFYPGALDAVAALAAADFKVAVCTNKPEYLARQLMQKMGALDLFGALIGADTLPVRKPDPEPLREAVRRAGGDPARAMMVGDTITDHDTARAAGVPSVLVTFGPNGGEMPALAPDALLHDYAELPEIAERLLA
ncbi:HAD-IA family hydrolase [Roseovarius nanhaiticus]|uniref:HAD-IA family hydrolase n=1 Tax=Roseovarius nanhaiticus TaxID=573024 RepID=UPI0024928511|nr:HAD-IA family hydrolase [Roseovarius nanhaiticus]